jgi:gamma-glutamyltranspeptidase/glutathione hydrolase
MGAARGGDPEWIARGAQGMVASDSPYASQAGVEILKAGGNAVDAAVGVSFALAVTRPYSTGLGGGGFMIVRFADGRVVVQDFRETAPARAAPDMYTKITGASQGGPPRSRYGHLAVAVPGLVAGRCQALAQHGTMPLAGVIGPAIELAKGGYEVDEDYAKASKEVLQRYERYPALRQSCGYVYETHLRGGKPRVVGERLVQPALARLLEGVASGGADFFYRGPVAEAIEREMRAHGGIVTAEDLAAYRVRPREAIRSTYREYEVIGMPPPSSGGVALAEALNILEHADFHGVALRDRGLALHYQVEVLRHAFADRARWLGDSDFVAVPTGLLVSRDYAGRLAARLDPAKVVAIDECGRASLSDDGGTSHFCVVDRWGHAVVSTETINTSFGSLAAVDEWGLILNNEMDDFAAEPGRPNAYGLVHVRLNAIAAGKRPLSSVTPTIVLKEGEPFLLLGGSGGPRIISSVLNVLLGVTDLGLSLEGAMRAPRPHHQWKPDLVYFDAAPPREMAEALTSRGHRLADKERTGIVQAVLRSESGWIGASDPRKGGRPAGY